MAAKTDIRHARKRAGMTQAELAEATGVRQPNIAAYENGTRSPSEEMLRRLLSALRERPSVALARHRAEILELAAKNHAVDVRVFGSIARGEDGPDSDIDLLVDFLPGASLFDQVYLVRDLEELLGRHVDVLSDGGLTSKHQDILNDAVAL